MSTTPTQHTPRIRLQVSDTRFFAAFADSYRAFHAAPQAPITDDGIYAAFSTTYRDPQCSPCWKAGRIAGWFAALYRIPCTFEDAPAPARPRLHAPRAIEVRVIERQFVSCYRQGYEQAGTQMQGQPLTDDELFAVLDSAHARYITGHKSLTATRCCAGYLAGWFAHFYGVSSLVDASLLKGGESHE